MKQLCVIGDPVNHSLSPLMHNAALKHLGLQKEFTFKKLKVPQNKLADFIPRISKEEYIGISVTMPHKQAIIPYLDILSREAMLSQSVNTVTLTGGSLEGSHMTVGHNTDGVGCVKALEAAGVRVKGRTFVILGAGGAAKAIAISIALNGAKEIHILNRTLQAAEDIAEIVRNMSSSPVKTGTLDSMEDSMAYADVLINATPVGMKGTRKKTIVPANLIEQHMAVFDIVYEPIETKLLKDARKIGAKAIPGTEMLLYQGIIQFELFTGMPAPIDIMQAALTGV